MAFSSFEELAKSRAKWYAASSENGFSEGIERLLTKLYPDKAHFIFELLQNAEDAQATKVEFRLESDALVFIHNGKRLFDLRDVESITSIADSTKREDGTSIGKFGIGFKAVFSYTETPIIHSGEWHFKIAHMVVPEWCEDGDDPQCAQEGKTLFRFPFNKRQKDRSRAYVEILDGLRSLDAESILFLRNISEVRVSCAGGEISIAKSVTDHLVELSRFSRNGMKTFKTSRRYLQFLKVIDELRLEDGTTARSLSIGIAYRLEKRENAKQDLVVRLSDQYEIVPVTNRNVYVFFPAEKETSGLRFCLHAPFASTAARDSICNNQDNQRLLLAVSELQIESLPVLRDEGFLTTDFLNILPNSRDSLAKMYECFRERLVSVFVGQPFTPRKYGGHAPARQLRRGAAVVSDLFDDSDLRVLTGDRMTSWMKNASMHNSDADRFLEDLDISRWGARNLIDLLCRRTNIRPEDIVKQVFSRKNNGRLAEVYELIEDYLASHEKEADGFASALRRAPIFRTSADTFAAASDRLFSGRSIQNSEAGVKFVHPDILAGSRSERTRATVERFFRRLGIEAFSEEAMLKSFVEQYWKTKKRLSIEESVARLEILIQLVAQGKIESGVASCFPVIDNTGKYVKICKTFIDEPYASTGLACYAQPLENVGVMQLNDLYAQRLSKGGLEGLVENASRFGIRKALWLVDSPVYKNPMRSQLRDFSRRTSAYEHQSDYDIPGLDVFVKSPTLAQSKLIWEFILSCQESHLKAEYRANRSDSLRSVPAKFLQTLANVAWIAVETDGRIKLVKPKDATIEDLPRDWRCPKSGYDHPALKAMNFGQETKRQIEKRAQQDRFAKENGFANASEIEEIKKLKELCKEKGLSPKEVLEKIKDEHGSVPRQPKGKELPKRSSDNVDTRMANAVSRFKNAPVQTYVEVVRSVHIGNAKIRDEARTYLRSEYGSESDGEMLCQLCQRMMPFKGRDGKGYFDATQIFTCMKKDIPEQFIALCPTCRAKYDEWVRRSQERSVSLRDAIIDRVPLQGEGSVDIPLPGQSEKEVKNPLAGRSLHFTGTHFVDLRQAVFEDKKLGGLKDFGGLELDMDACASSIQFVDWYLQYDSSAKEMLKKTSDLLLSLDKSLKREDANAEFWRSSLDGRMDRILSLWDRYHKEHPHGSSREEARLSVEQYCRKMPR